MGKGEYAEKLKDPRWQKLRLQIFERDEWECKRCGDNENTLVVHHLKYIPGREPWEYPPEILLTLCEECHSEEYEGMPDAIGSLIEQIREKGFLSNDVREIALGINRLKMILPPDVIATIISYALGNDTAFHEIKEMYFKHLSENMKSKTGDNDGSSGTP
jgi:hypothetical protein